MKRLHALCLGAMAAVSLYAEAGISMTTDLPVGTEISFWVNTTSATQPVSVDFGDGEPAYFTIDPNQPVSNRRVTGVLKGADLAVEGSITELDARDLGLTSVIIQGMTRLERLELGSNHIENFRFVDAAPVRYLDLADNRLWNTVSVNNNLTLDKVGATLTDLDISRNEDIGCLHMGTLGALEYFTANDCPNLTTVFICAPEESHPNLRSIRLNRCGLSHFYPVSMPRLMTLEVADNQLVSGSYDTDPFVLGDYPGLMTLDVSGNTGISELDVTGCPELQKLHFTGCRISSIDLSQCPGLITLGASGNLLASLDLGNNKDLAYLYVAGNPLKSLDFEKMLKIEGVDISDTGISRVDLYNCYYLKSFVARNTKLEFVDFNAQQPERMIMIDLRDNPGFTPLSMAYTVKTLPVARSTMSTATSLYLAGSHPEIADIAYATSPDMHWVCDSEGDGSADYPLLAATVKDASLTGERVKGTLERLYPYGGLSLDYDLDLYQGEGGRFLLAQWEPEWFQTVASVTTSLRRGVPACAYAYPDQGMAFKSVTVNGKEIFSPWFIAEEDAEIRVNFVERESSVSFNVEPGQALSFTVATTTPDGTVDIDWGTGSRTPYTGIAAYRLENYDAPGTRVEGKAAGSTVTIYGDIAGVDISCYGEIGEELFGLPNNRVTAIDVTNAPALKLLNLYWNPVKTLDLSGCPELEVLDFSYTAVSAVDLSANKKLVILDGYANKDEVGDSFAQIGAIDLAGLTALRMADLHNQALTNLDVTGSPALVSLNVTNNGLTTLDLRANKALRSLRAGGNKLSALDLAANTALAELQLDGNELSAIDLSANTALVELSLANNHIKALETHMLPELGRLYVNGNGMTAEELNEIYYDLPERQYHEGDDDDMALKTNLIAMQASDREPNDAEGADGSIAVARQWNPNPNGTNSGSSWSYLDIAPSANGSVAVTDAAGNTYTTGSKVKKYTKLTVAAAPAAGNEYLGFTLNGEELTPGTTFLMPGIYTRFAPVFSGDAGIGDVAADGATLSVTPDGAGSLAISAPAASATIFAADGSLAAEAVLTDSAATVAVPAPGVYFVRVVCGGKPVVKSVIVR